MEVCVRVTKKQKENQRRSPDRKIVKGLLTSIKKKPNGILLREERQILGKDRKGRSKKGCPDSVLQDTSMYVWSVAPNVRWERGGRRSGMKAGHRRGKKKKKGYSISADLGP